MIWSWFPARLLFSLTDNNNGLGRASISGRYPLAAWFETRGVAALLTMMV
jgi:hypothetical protein